MDPSHDLAAGCCPSTPPSSLLGNGGSDAISVCVGLGRLSAWQAMADEVELPVQGLDLVIHLGNEVICRRPPQCGYFDISASTAPVEM